MREHLEFGGFDSQDELTLVSVFDSLGTSHDRDTQDRIEEFKRIGPRGRKLRKAFMAQARAIHAEYAEDCYESGRPVLGLIKWLVSHPQVVIAIIQIVLMVL